MPVGPAPRFLVPLVPTKSLAEYAPNAPVTTPDKEYGYRNGQLLVTAAAVDLALGKTATQSNTFTNVGVTFYASRAVDGNTSGDFWGPTSCASTDYGYQNWWQVDLGSSQAIGAIQVFPRTDCCPEMTANFYVLVSDNPFTSTDLNTTLAQSGVSNYWVADGTASVATVNVNRTGRYVRVQRSDSQYLVLAEVKVVRGGTRDQRCVGEQRRDGQRLVILRRLCAERCNQRRPQGSGRVAGWSLVHGSERLSGLAGGGLRRLEDDQRDRRLHSADSLDLKRQDERF